MLRRLLGGGRRTAAKSSGSTTSDVWANALNDFVEEPEVTYAPGTEIASNKFGKKWQIHGLRRASRTASPLHPRNAVYPNGFVDTLLAAAQNPRLGRKLLMENSPWIDGALAVGQGSFGKVLVVDVTPDTRQVLGEIRDGCESVVRGDLPPPGDWVAIKLAVWDPRQPFAEFREENVREAATHSWLLDRPPVTVPGCGRKLLARTHLPRLYFAGLLKVGGREAVFVTVMEEVRGATMWNTPITLDKYLAVEAAACSLWANGVMHADLHPGNVMWDDEKDEAIIIDLGFATLLPATHTQTIVRALAMAVATGVSSLGAIFRANGPAADVQRYVNGVLLGRGRKLYWADYLTMLRAYFNKLGKKDKADVPFARKLAWQMRMNNHV